MTLFLKAYLKKIIFVRKIYFYLKKSFFKFKSFYLRNYYFFFQKKKLKQIKNKKVIKVAFLISKISQWKCQSIYLDFKKNKRFDAKIYVVADNTDIEDNIFYNELIKTLNIFNENKIDAINAFNSKNNLDYIHDEIYNSDIIFFTRETKFGSKFGLQNFKNSLTCYIPYSFHIDKNDYLQFGKLFHQCLWTHYLPINSFINLAKKIYPANNCKVVGYPGLDPYIDKKYLIIDKNIKTWKHHDKKKIIWAPHHSIEEGSHWPLFSTFLIYFEKMSNLLDDENNNLEICFKPHPSLKKKLYNHPHWGKHKTDEYYSYWSQNKNGILNESIYHDLFLSADAMILDSVSFMTEFSFTEKPICFLTRKDKGDYSKFLNNAGPIIFNSINKASSWAEILEFIDQVKIDKLNNISKKSQSLLELGISKKNVSSKRIIKDIINSIE